MEASRQAGEVSPYELVLSFDGRDSRQARAAALIHAFDVWSQVEVRDRGQLRPAGSSLPPTAEIHGAQTTVASSTPSDPTALRGLELTTHDGLALTGYSLFVYVARRLRLLWPL